MYYKLSSENLWNDINEKFSENGGTYSLHWLDGELKPVKISRLFGIDEEGILYIGRAISFLDRIITLKKTLIYKSSGHIAGRRINSVKIILNKIPIDNLYVSLNQTDNSITDEKLLIKTYEENYGELPPLNRLNKKRLLTMHKPKCGRQC